MIYGKMGLVLAFLTTSLIGQTLPQFMFGTGITASPYATAPSWTGKVSETSTFAVKTGATSNLYSWSSLQIVPGISSGAILSTGAAYVPYQSGKFSLLVIGQAGLTVNSNVTLGAFSGGGAISYQVNAPNQLYLIGGMTVTGISGNTVQPSFGLGIFKAFN